MNEQIKTEFLSQALTHLKIDRKIETKQEKKEITQPSRTQITNESFIARRNSHSFSACVVNIISFRVFSLRRRRRLLLLFLFVILILLLLSCVCVDIF